MGKKKGGNAIKDIKVRFMGKSELIVKAVLLRRGSAFFLFHILLGLQFASDF